MNKIMKENIQAEATKVKLCLLGQISTDINNRLPKEPEPLNRWEKYKLIKSGDAKLIRNLKMAEVIETRHCYAVHLVNAFTYPKSEEQTAYDAAYKGVQDEKTQRELAVENALRNLVAKALLEVISKADFLKKLDIISSQKW